MAEPCFAGVERLNVTRQAVAVLLVAQHVKDGAADGSIGRQRRGVVESQTARGEPLHDRGHLARRGLAQSELGLVGWHRPGGGDVDLLVEHGLVETGCAQGGVDVREAEPVDGHVGGGVVAENHHQPEGVAQGEREGRRQLAEDAGALDLVRLRENERSSNVAWPARICSAASSRMPILMTEAVCTGSSGSSDAVWPVRRLCA